MQLIVFTWVLLNNRRFQERGDGAGVGLEQAPASGALRLRGAEVVNFEILKERHLSLRDSGIE
jgi:hypothetical protein